MHVRLTGVLISFVMAASVSALTVDELKQKHQASSPEQLRELADAFAGGVGVQADPNSALALYVEAASLGDAEAAFSAGYRLLVGVSVKPNKTEAKKHLNFAASQQHPAAMLWLGLIAEEEKALGEAEDWYRNAAGLNVVGAYDKLALLMLKTPATAQNLATLHAFVTQGVGLDEAVQKQIVEQDYLGSLGLDDAKFLQAKLTERGFDTKGVDGAIGPNSKKALAAFQKSKGRTNASELKLTIVDLKELGFF